MEPGPRHWRPAKQSRPASSSPTRHRRAIAVGAVLLALLGGLLAWLTYVRPAPPRPRFLSLALDEYPPGTPVPPWLRQDAEALAALGWSNSASAHTSQQGALLM